MHVTLPSVSRLIISILVFARRGRYRANTPDIVIESRRRVVVGVGADGDSAIIVSASAVEPGAWRLL